jgi:hypothetical protein
VPSQHCNAVTCVIWSVADPFTVTLTAAAAAAAAAAVVAMILLLLCQVV